tara:strand:- start:31007 stop:33190 length:2184 start_codon:yes stop_codon:yes gene_type:complete
MTNSKNRIIIISYLSLNLLFAFDYLILTPSSLLDAAIEIQDIYSSDTQKAYYLDVEIEIIESMSNLEINELVDSQISNNPNLKYLLILGDENNSSFFTKEVPCGDDNQYLGYPTDDYYSSENSNNFLNSPNSMNNPRLATGRIPASNLNQAMIYINKLRNYLENQDYGEWRSKILLVSDDENKNGADIEDEIRHTQNSDLIYKKISEITFSKTLYGPMYESVYSGGERRLPDLTNDIISNLNNGVALINYIGHGDPEKWSAEHIINKDRDINLIDIKHNKLPIWVAGTCSFGRYDNADSMAEALLFETNGAISIIGAARSINESVNKAFTEELFESIKLNIEGEDTRLRLGDIFLNAKNSLTNSHYSLSCNGGYLFDILGDPAIPLPFPKKELISNLLDINIPNEINILETYNFNSAAEYSYIEILEYQEEITISFEQDNIILEFTPSPESIYHSQYINETCFTVSKDMSNKSVFIKYYSENIDLNNFISISNLIDVININENQINDIDTTPPNINFLLNNTNLETNSYISSNSNIIVQITDENGINTSNNIGHGTRYGFTTTNDLNYLIDNQNYIFLDNCNGISFSVNLPENLNHESKLIVESWDNANNKSLDSLTINIIPKSNNKQIFNVYNFPNPFSSRTFFTYQIQDFSPTQINTQINIYTQSGILVNQINKETDSFSNFVNIEWDGKDSDYNLLPNGTYLYSMKIIFNNNTYEEIGQLSIIR